MTVYVVQRYDPDYSLTVGVFRTLDDAKRYVEPMVNGLAVWSPARPGRQWWQLKDDEFTYTIEPHMIREGTSIYIRRHDGAPTPLHSYLND
jgi:hypothetical protein